MKRILLISFALFASFLSAGEPGGGPKLGLQTWTCRGMTFEQVVDFTAAHNIKYLQLIAAHLDPTAPREESLRKKALLEARGLVAYSFGVNKTSLDEAANRQLFEFARLMDIKVIIVEPQDIAEWDILEKLVKEYDIKLAIHNHGRGTTYGDPAVVKEILAKRDHRIGVCLDVGWVTAAGFDAAEVFRDYGDRVFDIHFKDKKGEKSGDQTVWLDTEVGQGQANFAALFAEIKKTGWSGVMAIETDSKAFAANPAPLVKAAASFFAKQVHGGSAGAGTPPVAMQPGPGHRIYSTYCVACHGAELQGNPALKAPSLVDVGGRRPREEVMKLLATGKGLMPPFPMIGAREKQLLVDFLFGTATAAGGGSAAP